MDFFGSLFSKIIFESRFLKKSYIVTVLKKKNERFDQFKKRSKKNGIPFVFSNLARPMVGGNFTDTIWVILSF